MVSLRTFLVSDTGGSPGQLAGEAWPLGRWLARRGTAAVATLFVPRRSQHDARGLFAVGDLSPGVTRLCDSFPHGFLRLQLRPEQGQTTAAALQLSPFPLRSCLLHAGALTVLRRHQGQHLRNGGTGRHLQLRLSEHSETGGHHLLGARRLLYARNGVVTNPTRFAWGLSWF